jgi:hypothetical protein
MPNDRWQRRILRATKAQVTSAAPDKEIGKENSIIQGADGFSFTVNSIIGNRTIEQKIWKKAADE